MLCLSGNSFYCYEVVMGLVRLVQDTASRTYLIDHVTDEKLYVLAELFLDQKALESAQGLIESIASNHAKTSRFQFTKRGTSTVRILFYKSDEALDEDNPLIVDMDVDNLDDLIDAWELFMLDKPRFISFTRRNDEDVVELIPEKV